MNLYEAMLELTTERRDHKTTRKYLSAYRWIAVIGWGLFVTSLLVQP